MPTVKKKIPTPEITAGEKRTAFILAGYFGGVFFANLVLPFAAFVIGVLGVIIFVAVGVQNRKREKERQPKR